MSSNNAPSGIHFTTCKAIVIFGIRAVYNRVRSGVLHFDSMENIGGVAGQTILTDGLFIGNHGLEGGALHFATQFSMSIFKCVFESNRAAMGGAIYVRIFSQKIFTFNRHLVFLKRKFQRLREII